MTNPTMRCKSDDYIDEGDLEGLTAAGLIEWATRFANQIPAEYQSVAVLERAEGYDAPLRFVWQRPMTDEEAAAYAQRQAATKAAREIEERATFERLKKKFEAGS